MTVLKLEVDLAKKILSLHRDHGTLKNPIFQNSSPLASWHTWYKRVVEVFSQLPYADRTMVILRD